MYIFKEREREMEAKKDIECTVHPLIFWCVCALLDFQCIWTVSLHPPMQASHAWASMTRTSLSGNHIVLKHIKMWKKPCGQIVILNSSMLSIPVEDGVKAPASLALPDISRWSFSSPHNTRNWVSLVLVSSPSSLRMNMIAPRKRRMEAVGWRFKMLQL